MTLSPSLVATLLLIGVAGLLFLVLFWGSLVDSRPLLRFENGQAVQKKGKIPPQILREVEEIAGRARASGTVWFEPDSRPSFSEDFPEGAQQRIRNVLHLGRGLHDR